MRRIAIFSLLFCAGAAAQTVPTPLLVSRVNNITSAAQVQDNRSQAARYCDYHSFYATGTGSWSVTMEFSDAGSTGPWTSFGSSAVITNASNPAIGVGFGYHPFIRFNTTLGSTVVNYTCQSSLYIPPGGSGGGGVTFPITIEEGGTSATTATGATINLQYLAPYTGSIAESDATAFNRTVSVWEFGSYGTTTDWTNAFQNAINVYTQRGGVGVYIPCGTYNFTNSLSVYHQPVSMVGESEHCVVLNYTGTGTFLQVLDTPPTGGPHGEYRNFTIATPNATTSTIAMEVATSHVLFENLQVTSCAAGTAWQIDNGLVNSGTGAPWYGEFNTWVNTSSDHCRIGYHFTPSGSSPPSSSQSFMDYNYFDNISGFASSGQTVFQVDPGFLFTHNFINVACKLDNFQTISSTLPSVCIKTSTPNWTQNVTYASGEWNNTVGTSTGPPYSVQILSGGSFKNSGGSINIFAIPGQGGAQVAVDNEAGNGDGTPFVTVHQQYQPDWDTGTFTLNAASTTPWTGFRDQGTGTLGVLEGANINSPFVTMNATAGNKFIIGKVTPGSVIGTMTDLADVDTSGNLFLKGSTLSINGLSWLWPTTHSAGCLYDDGSGNISIQETCSGGGGGSGLQPPASSNVALMFTSGTSTAAATGPSIFTALGNGTSVLDQPNGLPTLDASTLLKGSEIPPSSNSLFGGVEDQTCPSGSHFFSLVAGIIKCTPDSGAGSGSAISALTDATATNTLSIGNNKQTWNCNLTTAGNYCMNLSESAPSSASGTPVLLNVASLAGSNAYPFQISAQGNGLQMTPNGLLQAIPSTSGGIDGGSIVNRIPIASVPQVALQTFQEAAGCTSGIPYSAFDLPNTNAPVANCSTVGSYPYGTLDFADDVARYAYVRIVIPSGTVTEDIDIYWYSSTDTQSVKWTVATACVASGSDVISPTFNTAQTVTTVSGAAHTLAVSTITGVTISGCNPNDEEIFEIGRDVTDTSAAVASMRGIRPTVHQTLNQ